MAPHKKMSVASVNDILEIVDVLEELEDKRALKLIAQGRRAIRKGAKGVPVSTSDCLDFGIAQTK